MVHCISQDRGKMRVDFFFQLFELGYEKFQHSTTEYREEILLLGPQVQVDSEFNPLHCILASCEGLPFHATSMYGHKPLGMQN